MFACNYCNQSFKVISQFNRHQILHRNVKNFKITCLYSHCTTQCTSYLTFRQHNARYHNNIKESLYTCSYENCNLNFYNVQSLKKHRLTHSKKSANDTYYCGFCRAKNVQFKTLNAYNIHVSRYHKIALDEKVEFSKTESPNSRDKVNDNYDSEIPIEISTKAVASVLPAKDWNNYIPSAEKIFSKLYSSLTAKHLAPEPLVQNVVNSISEGYDCCSTKFKSALKSSGLSLQDQRTVEDCFDQSFVGIHETHKPNGIFSTSFKRNCQAKLNEKYVEPVKIYFKNENGTNTEDYYSYVPLLETLNVMFTDEGLYEKCFLSTEFLPRRKGLFDISDGTIVTKNEFFVENPQALKIILFQDGFEVCNPIGTSRKKFSMIGVYMMLGNLPPHLRSKSENIKLVSLCQEKHVRFYKWKQFLDRVIADLKYLETDGIVVNYKNTENKINGTLLAMAGDNLGSHQIGGFVENFSSTPYSSRYCETQLKDFRDDPFQSYTIRTVNNYNENAEKAMLTKKLVKGIRLDSILNTLLHYHVCNPGLPPCIAHDIFEGIVPTDLWLAIKYFIKTKKWLRIGQLNYRLNDIKVQFLTRVAIPKIKLENNTNKKLVGTASQIRYLLLILPLAIVDFIKDYDDEVWQMVLHLRKICSIVCAPWLSRFQVESLREEIRDYMEKRISEFPNEPLKPKHLFVMRYPDLIVHFGPLKHLWTLRFESQHQYFKNVIKHSQNFKSVTQTLSEKHEILHSTQCNTYDDLVKLDSFVLYDVADFGFEINDFVRNLSSDGKSIITYVCEKVSFRGITYSKGMAVCVEGSTTLGDYIICNIHRILVNNNQNFLYFIGTISEIIYHPLIGVYETIEHANTQTKMILYPYSSLISADPIPQCHIQQVQVYLPKYTPYFEDH